jgi:hypothetical protein
LALNASAVFLQIALENVASQHAFVSVRVMRARTGGASWSSPSESAGPLPLTLTVAGSPSRS